MILPVVSIVANRLFEESLLFKSLSDLTVPLVPSPNVMLVAVPLPVAPIVSVRPLSGVVPAVRACVTPVPRPRAASAAAFELVTDRSAVVPVWSEILPAVMDEPDPPLRPSILPSKAETSSVMLIWFAPLAPEATKVSV